MIRYSLFLNQTAVITAFQIRLNENASSIVDALVSLRFSVGDNLVLLLTTPLPALGFWISYLIATFRLF